MDFRAFDESLEKLRELEALSHEFKMSERQLQIINNDIIHTEQEVNKLRLEWEWCFNITGRKFLSPEKQAVKICEELVSHPELLEDTVKALRMKKIDIQCNVKELEQMCTKLKEDIKTVSTT